MPVTTYSCHYFLDKDFEKAISDFLVRETAQVFISILRILLESCVEERFIVDLVKTYIVLNHRG